MADKHDSDVLTMLRNNPIFKHALDMAQSQEEREEIERSAVTFAEQIIGVFNGAISRAFTSQDVSNKENIIVSERTGRTSDG
jgi:hypothetical protein